MSKEKKLIKDATKKKKYLKTYKSRINRGDKSTPTYAQWASATTTEKGLMAAGINPKKFKVSKVKSKKPKKFYRKKKI